MCTYIHAYMHICTYVHTHSCIYTCVVNMCHQFWVCARSSVNFTARKHHKSCCEKMFNTCVTCIYIYTYLCIYTHIYINIHTHIYIYISFTYIIQCVANMCNKCWVCTPSGVKSNRRKTSRISLCPNNWSCLVTILSANSGCIVFLVKKSISKKTSRISRISLCPNTCSCFVTILSANYGCIIFFAQK